MNYKKIGLSVFYILFFCVTHLNAMETLDVPVTADTETLFFLVKEGKVAALSSLVTADNVNIFKSYGNSLLCSACNSHQLEVVKLFLALGADVNFEGEFQNIDYNEEDEHFTTKVPTSLHRAAECKDSQILSLLLDKGAFIDSQYHWKNFTPLHCAVAAGAVENVRMLCQKGAKIDEKNKDCKTPLHLLLEPGVLEAQSLPIFMILINYNASIDEKDDRGRDFFTALRETRDSRFVKKIDKLFLLWHYFGHFFTLLPFLKINYLQMPDYEH